MGVDLGCESADAVPGTPDATGFSNQTIRNIVFTSVSGNLVRVRFTNTFGDQPHGFEDNLTGDPERVEQPTTLAAAGVVRGPGAG